MSRSVLEQLQPQMAMLALQLSSAGSHLISKAVLNMGISKIVFLIYWSIITLFSLSPFAYFREEKKWDFWFQFFLLALVGITANQGFYLLALDNTSPTFVSAIENSVPAIIFLKTAIGRRRIEGVQWSMKDLIAKVLGMACVVVGSSMMMYYKEPTMHSPDKPSHLYNTNLSLSSSLSSLLSSMYLRLRNAKGKNWTLGCLFLFGHCLSCRASLVLEARLLTKHRVHHAQLFVMSYMWCCSLIQFLVIATFIERGRQAWLVHSGAEAFSIFYVGVEGAMRFAVHMLCIDRHGDVFAALYHPVQTLSVAVVAYIAFGEQFYLGEIIGAVLIIAGLYLVLWEEIRKVPAHSGGGYRRLCCIDF